MKLLKLLLVYSVLFTAFSCVKEETYISPSNTNLFYEGRIDFSEMESPVFSWPGTNVNIRFKGTSIKLLMNDENHVDGGLNYFNVVLDDSVIKTINVYKESKEYFIANHLKDTIHTLQVFKRTESFVGKSQFLGFQMDGKILPWENNKQFSFEFIGDSWTCGYGNEMSFAVGKASEVGFHSINENNYNAYGAILSRNLNANYRCMAYSGKGIYRNYNGSKVATMLDLYDFINADEPSVSVNHKNYKADVVFIKLGTNDFAKEIAINGREVLDSIAFVNSYSKLVKKVRVNNPDAHLVLLYGNSITDSFPKGRKWLTRWRNYIKSIQGSFVDKKIHSFELSPQSLPYGEDWHPSTDTHFDIANQLTPFVKDLLRE